MKSLFLPEIRKGNHQPIVYAYYDRADMYHTTPEEHMHLHTLCEIMYVNEGNIRVVLKDSQVNVGRKQFIWIDSGVPHMLKLRSDTLCSVMNIEFQFEDLPPRTPSIGSLYQHEPIFRDMLDHPVPYLVLTDTDDTIFNIIKQIISLADSTHRESEALCSLLTSQVLVLMARRRKISEQKTSAPIRNAYVSAAAEYIDEHYWESLTVQQIASVLHVQPTYLHRLFREHTTDTVHEYIQKTRIAHAKTRLEETNDSLLDIANHVGMPNQQRFSQLFRRLTNLSPSEYRELSRKRPQHDQYEED